MLHSYANDVYEECVNTKHRTDLSQKKKKVKEIKADAEQDSACF